MKPTKKKIKAEKRKLRKICDSDDSQMIIDARMAQAMEYAIRWLTEETVGWLAPSKEVGKLSIILKTELGAATSRG